ncbi:hypothetical protein QFZ43_005369 [Streptomyces afghaniensis]|nr:hypothetical protein [Streptomyces afghaniensis]
MTPLTVAILLAPLVGTLAGIGCRRARRTWRRWAQ